MKNIYLIKQNPDSKKSDIVWIEMNREEFQAFIHSDNAVGRYFARLRKSDDETQNIIYETDEKSYAKWRIEKRHFQYLRDSESAKKYTVVSYDAIDPNSEISREELLADDYDLLEAVIKKLQIEQLRKSFGMLKDDEKWLLTELYLLPKSKKERQLSHETGIPQKTLNDRKKRALEKLRQYIEKQY